MGEGRRVEALLAAGRREEAEAVLRSAGAGGGGARAHAGSAAETGAAEAGREDPWLHLLGLWVLERPRGPGHVTAGLAGWAPPPPDHPDASRCRSLAAALRASEAMRTGDTAGLLHHAREAEAALPPHAPWPAFVVAAVLQGAYRMTGDGWAARSTLDRCEALGDRTDLPWLAVQARALGGSLHMLRGRFHRADDLLASALELAATTGRDAGSERAMALQFRGYLRYEWNRLDEARELLLEAVGLGEESGSRGVLTGCFRMLMEVGLAGNDGEEAGRWLRRLEGAMEGPLSDRNREWLTAVQARYRAVTGDVRGAADAVRARGWRAEELAREEAPVLLGRLGELATLLDVLGLLERWDGLVALAARVRAVAGAADRRWFAVRAGAWEAAGLEAVGRTDEADRALEALVPPVEEEGYLRVLADVGAPLLPALERLAGDRPSSGALGRVLVATRLQASWRRPRPSLTPREAQILGLLARGGSTRSIAGHLGVSQATVKTHLHHLYRKLDVGSRTQAVARAESLALL